MRWSGKYGLRSYLEDLGVTFTDTEWQVMRLYLGWGRNENLTQAEVGERIGLAQPQVSSTYRWAYSKMERAYRAHTVNETAVKTIREALPDLYAELERLAEMAGTDMKTVAKKSAANAERVAS